MISKHVLARALLVGAAICSLAACTNRAAVSGDDGGATGRLDGGSTCASGRAPCGGGCCQPGERCVAGACAAAGPKCGELWPCPAGSHCDPKSGKCVPGTKKCQYIPPVGAFSPREEWSWKSSSLMPTHDQVMMAPMVANLTDDNGDGKVDLSDVPDIVFHTFTGARHQEDGVMRVISGDGKGEHLAITKKALAHRTQPGTQVALGDIDGDKMPEIVACAHGGGVFAFERSGALKWKAPGVECRAPAIADLDGDGFAEVVSSYTVLRGRTGKVWWTKPGDAYTAVADIDEDGFAEVVGGNTVYRHNGALYWADSSRPDGHIAIADLDGDGSAEIVTASDTDHALRAHHHDGKPAWKKMPVDINQGQANLNDKCGGCGGGPPTVADFDGDGKPEIAVAAGYGYVVFEHDGKAKWFQKTKDHSSRHTGSSVFDFEGDGKAEAVYGDQVKLRIYRGADGKVLHARCNTSGTLVEYPVIVDVDNDGQAEIVAARNNYIFKKCSGGGPSSTGIAVLGDASGNWVRTRRIWNQHTYHVTNISEDGQIPKKEQRHWDNPHLNSFRQNSRPGGLFDAPDLTGARGAVTCAAQITVVVKVSNQGSAESPPGIRVSLWGAPAGQLLDLLGVAGTKTRLLPGKSESLTLKVKTPAAFNKKKITLEARIDDDGHANGKVNECKEGNNRVALGQVFCS